MAYILGFIYADACIQNNASKGRKNDEPNRLRIELKDREILMDIVRKMDADYPVIGNQKPKGYYYYLCITRKELVQDLMKVGLIRRKSSTMKFPDVPEEFFYHFVRGYFDGDGSVYKHRKWNSIGVKFSSTSRDFLDSLQQEFRKRKIETSINPRKYKNPKWKTCYSLYVFAAHYEFLFHQMYQNATIFLDRKYKIFNNYFRNNLTI
jgi:hypothetical protein